MNPPIPTGYNGLIAIVKRECETCVMVESVLGELARHTPFSAYTQDDPTFPGNVPHVIDDTDLSRSYALHLEIVPTLLKVENGVEVGRIVGWQRDEWQAFTGIADLGNDLPAFRPGCGSRTLDPGMPEKLAARIGSPLLQARRVVLADLEDDIEACYERGWSDGLPLVPPTEARVLRMLEGTSRDPQEVIGSVPPDNAACTVEKVAINAVMAGCKPEYLPVVLAAVEAALLDEFCMHGLLATTWFSGPVVVVNGPAAQRIGMNSGVNALGQGNRANATIGRALQLVIRNVGGGKPGGVDRSTLGNPGKYSFCFAENEAASFWESLAVERGFAAGSSTVTLFAGDGVQGVMDQLSRTPESLTRTFAACLRASTHPKIALVAAAMLVIAPEHMRVYREAGWSKQRFRQELAALLLLPGRELVRGADGIAEGIPDEFAEATLPKFMPSNFHVVCAGGEAGLFSAIIGGWPATGSTGSTAVTREIYA